jgi:DNA polymerase-3 subunit delta'
MRGHTDILDQFRRALARGRLASTFLFVGPPGIGKRLFALRLAQGMLCERQPEEDLAPCGECLSCRQVLSGTHPDVHTIAKPPDRASIPVELLIGDKEHRMREGLLYELSASPYSGRRRIAIIDDADTLALGQKESANCLLKTLEEPPPKSVLILIGTSEQRQLPTIRSRCQVVRFSPLAENDVAEILVQQGLCTDPAAARKAAAMSGGSVERAQLWCDEAVALFRSELLRLLGQPCFDHAEAVKLVSQFAEGGGKEAAAKRARLKLAVTLAEEFYRERMLTLADESAAAGVESCLDAAAHIDANANQATLIEWWLDELRTVGFSPRHAVG